MSTAKKETIAPILILLFTAATAFTSAPVLQHHSRRSCIIRVKQQLELYAAEKQQLEEQGNGNDNESTGSSSSWSLEEDWALLDQVPKFTVGEKFQAKTFWLQLLVATPRLANREKEELLERYKELTLNTTTTVVVGESPPVLQEWSLDGTCLSGTLDKRTVWLQYQLMGRLDGDPAGDTGDDANNSIRASPGGFVEAVGGRVYELGSPRRREEQSTSSEATVLTAVPKNEDDGKDDSAAGFQLFPNWPWVSASTITVSALVATSVLSASIGYAGAGTQFRQQTIAYERALSAATPTSSAATKSTTTPVSTSEKRARTEAKVLQEKRMLQTLQNKLEKDQAEFKQLKQEELLSPPITNNPDTTTAASGKVELSVQEKRARSEGRVLREERLIQDIQGKLQADEASLAKLRQAERSELK